MNTDPASGADEVTRFAVATDGVKLAVQERGDVARQTVVLVHGFPDNRSVWAPVAERLARDFHVVTYDVRGTGDSGAPRKRRGYRMAQLSEDLATVIGLTSPNAPVHLMAHDWGSIQTWHSVTSPAFADRVLSFTSVSGPSLDMAGVWLRKGRRYPSDFLRQCADSWYIFAFQVPFLPEFLVRRGVVDALVARSERIGAPATRHMPAGRRPRRDLINGINLYRANIGSLMFPRPRRAVCPVQILAPLDDAHVTVPLALGAPRPYVDDLRVETIPGNHWVVEQDPALIAGRFTQFITTS
ncbi:alpha/beta fold hydrolase [Actinocorallia aurantiaca]|uniref:AB hydrolase-1 domain-containing protein n=1 Tax=Actinocorallia aurantiaca TaxID=46204 RepID=A0ABP6GZN5_9ACTN